jgi:Cytosolic carboxypeptidase N-terminal domain
MATLCPPVSTAKVPGHNVFEFESGVTFSSNFDNGNLLAVDKMSKPHEYKIYTAQDNHGSPCQSKHTAWFYFVVTGLPQGVTLRINIGNATGHSGLYKHDMVSNIYVCDV